MARRSRRSDKRARVAKKGSDAPPPPAPPVFPARSSRGIRAGEAFMARFGNDPEFQRWWHSDERRQRWEAFTVEIKRRLAAGHETWNQLVGQPMPLDLEEIRLAALRFGLSPDAVLKGDFTLADVTTIMVGKRLAAADELRDEQAKAEVWRAAGTPPAGGRGGAAEPERAKGNWLAEAMLMVRDNPAQSDAAIARAVGVHRSQLTRSREYKLAAGMARNQGQRPARGRVDRTGGIEATAPATPDRVVGEPVQGSRRALYWERCAERSCREWIAVAAAMVGADPLCEGCED